MLAAVLQRALSRPRLVTRQRRRHYISHEQPAPRSPAFFDVLIPMSKKDRLRSKTIAVGSGQAMAMGRKGEATCSSVHCPRPKKPCREGGGTGTGRRLVVHNDFIIVGPAAAGRHAGSKSAAAAFKKIAASQALFMSRGDNSGPTRRKSPVESSRHRPRAEVVSGTGLGMGQTLNVASEKTGIHPRRPGTYLALKKRLDLAVLVQGDRGLLNVYHVIEVNPEKWPKVNAGGQRHLPLS